MGNILEKGESTEWPDKKEESVLISGKTESADFKEESIL